MYLLRSLLVVAAALLAISTQAANAHSQDSLFAIQNGILEYDLTTITCTDKTAPRDLSLESLRILPFDLAHTHPSPNAPAWISAYGGQWHRLKIFNAASNPKKWVLRIQGSGYMAGMRIYIVTPTGVRNIEPADLNLPQYKGGVSLPLYLDANITTEIYFYADVRRVRVELSTVSTYLTHYQDNEATTKTLIIGYFGMAMIMILYNLMLFWVLRDRNYLYYLIYLTFFTLFVWLESGLSAFWLSFQFPSYYLYYANLLPVVFFFSILTFTIRFLKVPTLLPRLMPFYRIAFGLNIVVILLNLYGLVIGNPPMKPYDLIEQGTTQYCLLLGLVTGILAARKGYRPARFFLLGFTVLIVCAVVFSMTVLQLLPLTPLTLNALYLGSALEFALLSIALADRINVVKREKARERERISRDLHDSVGAQLAGILYGLHLTERVDPNMSDAAKQHIHSLRSEVQGTITQLRETIWALHPQRLTLAEFLKKLETTGNKLLQQADAPQLNIQLTGDANLVVSSNQALQLLRIAQEAIHNAVKHASARNIMVSLDHRVLENRLILRVEDDGIGLGRHIETTVTGLDHEDLPLSPTMTHQSISQFGLGNMQRRTEELLGKFLATDRPGGGCRIEASIPLATYTE